ncbi:hypothetical protein ADEAN_000309300 [Angomonas deanei]|uniref:Uncharacterized protein n=1 Tax=Angomonas deanei TaxID=59799 RepID=A0A7G2C745_9TRYP|nr:hypothetical protein ADEAN_000309300 [Angomonas deanei]
MTYWTRQQSEAHQQKEKESTDHHTNRLSLSAAPEQPGPTVAATKEERQRMTAELTSFLSTLEKVGEGTTHPGSRKVREGPLEVRAPRVLGDWQLLNKA